MPQNKRDVILQRRATVSEMYLQGFTQEQIAQKVGVKRPQISKDLKQIRKEWSSQRLDNIEEYITKHLKMYETVLLEASLAWEKSKGDNGTKKSQIKKKGKGKSKGLEDNSVIQKMEEVNGDPRFLDIRLKTIREMGRLLGLDAPQKVELDLPTTVTFNLRPPKEED